MASFWGIDTDRKSQKMSLGVKGNQQALSTLKRTKCLSSCSRNLGRVWALCFTKNKISLDECTTWLFLYVTSVNCVQLL
eukprot:GSA25T00022316001.1